MAEATLKAEVLKLARSHGWKVQHLSHEPRHAYRLGGRGFPDLVLARRGRVLFRELKREQEPLDPEQVAWAAELLDAFAVWRPSHLRLGIIHGELA